MRFVERLVILASGVSIGLVVSMFWQDMSVSEFEGLNGRVLAGSPDDDGTTYGDEHGTGHEGGHHNVFALGEEIVLDKVLYCFLVLIGFTVCFEVFIQRLEMAVEKKEYLKVAVEKIFRELMILGFISFSVFLMQTLSAESINEEWFLAFEFSHIVLFFMALAYVTQCVSAATFVIRNKAEWEVLDELTKDRVRDELQKSRKGGIRFGKVAESVNFFLLKNLFIKCHKLPSNFYFSDYMFKTLLFHIEDLMEIDLSSWGILLVFSCVLLLFYKTWIAALNDPYVFDPTTSKQVAYGTAMAFFIIGWLMLIGGGLLVFNVHQAIQTVVSNSLGLE